MTVTGEPGATNSRLRVRLVSRQSRKVAGATGAFVTPIGTLDSQTTTRRLGSLKIGGDSNTASMTLKMVVHAAIDRASDRIARVARPGALTRSRQAKRKSCIVVRICQKKLLAALSYACRLPFEMMEVCRFPSILKLISRLIVRFRDMIVSRPRKKKVWPRGLPVHFAQQIRRSP